MVPYRFGGGLNYPWPHSVATVLCLRCSEKDAVELMGLELRVVFGCPLGTRGFRAWCLFVVCRAEVMESLVPRYSTKPYADSPSSDVSSSHHKQWSLDLDTTLSCLY